jgi:hypothetical protein
MKQRDAENQNPINQVPVPWSDQRVRAAVRNTHAPRRPAGSSASAPIRGEAEDPEDG